MLGNFSCFYFFQTLTFSKNYSRNTIRAPNSLDPDISPDLGPNCLQRLSAKERVNKKYWALIHNKMSYHQLCGSDKRAHNVESMSNE